MAPIFQLAILIISIVVIIVFILKYRKKKSLGSLAGLLTGLIGLLYISKDFLDSTQPKSVINNSTIHNYYYINRDTVLNSTKVVIHYPIDTTYFHDTLYTTLDVSKIISDRLSIYMPEETNVALNANAFITLVNSQKAKIFFSYSASTADSIKYFGCNNIGVNELKIYAIYENTVIKEMIADFELKDPTDFCIRRKN